MALFLLSALEMLFPPLAGPVLPLAGIEVSNGEAGLVPTIVVASLGSTVGSGVLYYASRWFGADRVRSWLLSGSRWSRLSVEHFDRAEAWFARNSAVAVSLGRCVPVVRSLVSIPAGLVRMPTGRFFVLTAFGNALWCAAVILVASRLGEELAVLRDAAGFMWLFVAAVWALVVAAALAVWLTRRGTARAGIARTTRQGDEPLS